MFDDKDPFSNMSSNDDNLGRGSSERDRLDIDSQGLSKAEKDNKRRQEQQQQYDAQNKKGFGKNKGFRSGGNGGNGPKERSIFATVIIIAIIVGTIIYLPMAYASGSLSSPLRSIFASPEENRDNFFGAILDMDKTVTDLDKDPIEVEETSIYDKNDLHMESFLKTQVDPEYMVYIYTGDYELDAPFNDWITSYETKDSETVDSSDDSKTPKYENGKYKIYRLNISEITESVDVLDYVEGTPMVLIYNTPVKGAKLLDSVVKDAAMLDSVPDYMDKMVEEANANW